MEERTHKNYFDIAYKTGTDVWSLRDISERGRELLAGIAPGALVLELGSGRGRFAFMLAENKYRVIGIDFIEHIVDKNNREIETRGLTGKIRFITADVLDIPLTDESFNAVADIGTLEHLPRTDWPRYVSEAFRVLKTGGYYYLITLSRETPQFQKWNPKTSETGDYVVDGLHYHFFTLDEIRQTFGASFNLVSTRVEHHAPSGLYFLIVLLQKL